MAGEKKRTSFDRKIAESLRAQRSTWTPGCPEPDELLWLIDQEEELPEAASLRAHVASCEHCRRAYVEMRAILEEAGRLRNETTAQDPLPA